MWLTKKELEFVNKGGMANRKRRELVVEIIRGWLVG